MREAPEGAPLFRIQVLHFVNQASISEFLVNLIDDLFDFLLSFITEPFDLSDSSAAAVVFVGIHASQRVRCVLSFWRFA